MVKIDKQVVGNAGLFYVCFRLSQMGWNVMPTSRNARGVDLLAYSQDAVIRYAIQVKALSGRYAVGLGKSVQSVHADFLVICRSVLSQKPTCYVLTWDEVAKEAHATTKNGNVQNWIEPSEYERPEYENALYRIGVGGSDRVARGHVATKAELEQALLEGLASEPGRIVDEAWEDRVRKQAGRRGR